MTIKKENWIKYALLKEHKDEKVRGILIEFFRDFYNQISEINMVNKSGKSEKYRDEVKALFEKYENEYLSNSELRVFQQELESITILFDEKSIFKTSPSLLKKLISSEEDKEKECAKDYLKGKIRDSFNKGKITDSSYLLFLSEFGQYTIEALLIHVLSCVFNSPNNDSIMIRASTLMERIDSSLRNYSRFLKRKSGSNHELCLFADNKTENVKIPYYFFGKHLLDFLDSRKMIKYENADGKVLKKNISYFVQKNLYVVCNFDIAMLPKKLNLPMLCKPELWRITPGQKEKDNIHLSDISGGYLSNLSWDLYERYRVLSSPNMNHYNIYIGKNDLDGQKRLHAICDVMNKLQSQPFQVNSIYLKYILKKESIFVDSGYLYPRFVSKININDVSSLLRDLHMKNKEINKLFSYSKLIDILSKQIQRANYEQMIINIAILYNGYKFYFPAFLDFRGRIYRSGIIHFHEGDLARSLILFADNNKDKVLFCSDNYIMGGENCSTKEFDYCLCVQKWMISSAFHYTSFKRSNFDDQNSDMFKYFFSDYFDNNNKENLDDILENAKRPNQLLSNICLYKHLYNKYIMSKEMSNVIPIRLNISNQIPITQDASASAFQIMSYLLLDETMALRTNLMPQQSNHEATIQDVYLFFLEELKAFMLSKLPDPNLSSIIVNNLSRDIVKSIYMPMIYGKTLFSTIDDIKTHFSHFLTHKECSIVASLCFKFWKEKYPSMDSLISLIRHIGWIASARDRPVLFDVPYFQSIQDYMKMEPINIWLYDRANKKRRKVTLKVASSKRDRRKTEISTFVNFIHQKDAYIAMNVVHKMIENDIPIYTVHDNFLTTPKYCHRIPHLYNEVFSEMGYPLRYINNFILLNLNHSETNNEQAADCVFSTEYLRMILMKNIPDNINKRMRKSWGERITKIIDCYENYTHIVCGSSDPTWEDHILKWDDFKRKLLDQSLKCYSVHY